MRLQIHGSLGDEVALTGVLREIKKQRPREILSLSCRFPEVFERNPWLGPGAEDDGTTVSVPLAPNYRIGNITYAYGQHLRIKIYDSRPEIFLGDDELDALQVPPNALAIDVWAGWPRRRWAFERFVELVRLVRVRFPAVAVIEVGRSVGDCFGQRRDRLLPDVDQCFVDRLSVRQTASVLKKCRLYVGNDSGLSHVAAAVGTDQVTIYSMDWYSMAYRSTWPVFDLARNCQGCDLTCVQQPRCLDRVEPFDVLRVIESSQRLK